MPEGNEERSTWDGCRRLALGAALLGFAASLAWLGAWREGWLDREAGIAGLSVGIGSLAACVLLTRWRWPARVAIVALAWWGVQAAPDFSERLAVRWLGDEDPANRAARLRNRMAADFTLDTIDGEAIRLRDLRGRVVALEIWRSWCPKCREQLAHLAHASSQLSAEGLVVVGINAEPAEIQAEVRRQLQLPFPLLVDDGSLPAMYRTSRFPRTFVIDRDGRIAGVDDLHGYSGTRALAHRVRAGGPGEGRSVPPPGEAEPLAGGRVDMP